MHIENRGNLLTDSPPTKKVVVEARREAGGQGALGPGVWLLGRLWEVGEPEGALDLMHAAISSKSQAFRVKRGSPLVQDPDLYYSRLGSAPPGCSHRVWPLSILPYRK